MCVEYNVIHNKTCFSFLAIHNTVGPLLSDVFKGQNLVRPRVRPQLFTPRISPAFEIKI